MLEQLSNQSSHLLESGNVLQCALFTEPKGLVAGHSEKLRWLSHGLLRMDMSTSGYDGTVGLSVSSRRSQDHMQAHTCKNGQKKQSQQRRLRSSWQKGGRKIREKKSQKPRKRELMGKASHAPDSSQDKDQNKD